MCLSNAVYSWTLLLLCISDVYYFSVVWYVILYMGCVTWLLLLLCYVISLYLFVDWSCAVIVDAYFGKCVELCIMLVQYVVVLLSCYWWSPRIVYMHCMRFGVQLLLYAGDCGAYTVMMYCCELLRVLRFVVYRHYLLYTCIVVFHCYSLPCCLVYTIIVWCIVLFYCCSLFQQFICVMLLCIFITTLYWYAWVIIWYLGTIFPDM